MTGDKIKEGFGLIARGISALSTGPCDFYVDQLVAARELLLTRFAPFKVGDKVSLIQPHPAPGHWASCKHFLIPGEPATIENSNCDSEGRLYFDCVFDNETWINDAGTKRPASSPHLFRIYEHELTKFEPKLVMDSSTGEAEGGEGVGPMTDKYDEETRILLRLPPNYSGGTICDDIAARLRADGERIAKLEAVSMAAKDLISGMNIDDWRWLTADHRQTLTQLDEALRDFGGGK